MRGGRIKHVVWGMVVVFGVAALAAAWLLRHVGAEGQTALEHWIGQQLQWVVSGYLTPQLRFEQLDYQYPRTVLLTDARLVAQDPAAPGRTVDVIRADRLRIELAQVPRQGEPLVIESIEADAPVLRLIEHRAGSQVMLIGLTGLLRDAPATVDGRPPAALSDVFQMNRVALRDAVLVYDPRQPDQPPMRLDGFSTHMTFDRDDKGWYAFRFGLARQPVLDLIADGRLDLDHAQIEWNDAKLALDLGSQQAEALPPAVQRVLRDHDVTGRLNLDLAGLVPFDDWRAMRLSGSMVLEDANAAFGDYRLPVRRLALRAVMENRTARIEPIQAALLDGTIEGQAVVHLDLPMETRASLRWEGLSLSQAVRGRGAGGGGAETAMSGTIQGQAELTLPLAAATTQAGGHGRIAVRAGRFVAVPVVANVTGALQEAAKAVGRQEALGHDTADAVFELRGDHAHLSSIQIATAAIAMSGKGNIGFDSSLDLHFNGGPIKKVQQKLGVVGKVLGGVTDTLARYEVQGTLAEPEVSLAIAAAPAERAPEAENPRQTPASELFEDLRKRREPEDDPAGQPKDPKKDRFGF